MAVASGSAVGAGVALGCVVGAGVALGCVIGLGAGVALGWGVSLGASAISVGAAVGVIVGCAAQNGPQPANKTNISKKSNRFMVNRSSKAESKTATMESMR